MIYDNIKSLFLSPRFVAYYWQAGSIAVLGLLNMISENITTLGLPAWLVVGLGLAISTATKALDNLSKGKEMGFAAKN